MPLSRDSVAVRQCVSRRAPRGHAAGRLRKKERKLGGRVCCNLLQPATMKLLLVALSISLGFAGGSAAPSLLFVTDGESNDLLVAARKGAGATVKTFPSVAAALAQASEGDGVLVMADGMRPADPGVPQKNTTAVVTPAEWDAFRAKKLKAYVEFPRAAPGETQALEVGQTLWERVAVSEPAGLGPGLPYLALLHAHKKVDFVKLPPSWLANQTSLVIAKVPALCACSVCMLCV